MYPLDGENSQIPPLPRKYTVRCTVSFYGDIFHFVDINVFSGGKLDRV